MLSSVVKLKKAYKAYIKNPRNTKSTSRKYTD